MGLDFEVLFRCVITVDILLCAAIIIINLLLLLSIVTSRVARARTRNAMLVSMCLADLMVGVFTHPVYIHSYRTGNLFHSCEMHIVLQLIGDYSQDFVCFWTLVTLGMIYAYRLTAHRWGWGGSLPGSYGPLSEPTPSKCRSVTKMAEKVLLVCWPWLGTLIIPIPILLANVEPEAKALLWDETFCPLHTPFPSRMVVLMLVFYVPIAILFFICLHIGLVMYCDMATARSRRHVSDQPDRSAHRPHAFAVSSGEVEMGAGSEHLMTRDGVAGGGGLHEPFPASKAHRAGRGGRANGHPGSPIYTGPAPPGIAGRPPPTPTLSSLRDEPRDTAPAAGGWAADDDDDGDDPTHVMMSPVGQCQEDSNGNEVSDVAGQRNGSDRGVIRTLHADPTVTLVGGWRRLEAGNGEVASFFSTTPTDNDLEKPGHMLLPLLLVVVCTAPLMVGWWFYERMEYEEHEAVIILSVTLSRLYLLRAALLPAAWFTLPELRSAAWALWNRLSFRSAGGGGGSAGGGSDPGEFSVAYTTLRETSDAPTSADDRPHGERSDVRRQNPFDTDVRV